MPDLAALHPVSRRHLEALSDDIGIMQHATGRMADPAHGYCTDDVARALMVDVDHAAELGWAAIGPSASRAVRFLEAAFDAETGRFRNLRDAGGAWHSGLGSEDAHGRAMHGLGQLIAVAPDAPLRSSARALFRRGLPGTLGLMYLRPQAAALLGCEAAIRGGLEGESQATYRDLAATLWRAVTSAPNHGAWPWPEPILTYENGLIPQALLVSGRRLGWSHLVRHGRYLLDWLVEVETATEGHLTVVGNAGWWPRDAPRARYDQQPIEATALLLAAEAAYAITADEGYRTTMERCYAWFLGSNDTGEAIAIPGRGACHDGLSASGVNANQGAESTLMWLIALERIRRLRGESRAALGPTLQADVPLRPSMQVPA